VRSGRTPGTHALFVIFATVLIDTIGFGIIIPVTPDLLVELTGASIGGASAWHGALFFSFAVAQFFCAPILGNLSDRFGRRPVILASLLAFGLDYIIMGSAQWIGWLFAGRIVAGIAGAAYTPAYAYLADISPPEKRAQNFGLIGAAFGAGFVIGPAIGGLLGGFGTRAPFYVAGAMALANLAAGWFLLPETLAPRSRRPFSWARANPLGTLLHVRKSPAVTALITVTFLWQLAMQVYPSTWSFFTMLRFGWSEQAVGYSLAFVGVIMIITQGGLTRLVIPRVGEKPAALVGMLAGAASFAGYAFATQSWMMYAWMLAWFCAGLCYPSLNALMSRAASATEQGELQGAVACTYSLTSILGPPLLTQVLSRFSAADARIHFPGAAFLVAAALALCGSVLLARAKTSTPARDATHAAAQVAPARVEEIES
jgi:DHA1 family tetracycline resistance protein-like MFS transporter